MIETAIVVLWTALWLHPKWAILNKGGILLVLLMAPAIALVGWIKPEWLKPLVDWWVAYLGVFLAVGSLIIVFQTRRNTALAQRSREPTTNWFPIVAKASVPLAKRLPLLLLTGAFVAAVGVIFGHTPLQGAALGAFAIAVIPALPFVYVHLAVKLADFLSSSQPRST